MTTPPPPTPPLPTVDGGGQAAEPKTLGEAWDVLEQHGIPHDGPPLSPMVFPTARALSRLSAALAAARERETALRDDCARLRGACKEAVMLILEADATAQEDNYAKASADVRIVLCFAIAATEALALAPSPKRGEMETPEDATR